MSALDIGAGDGAFLEELLALGFQSVVGVEPSEAPIAAAKPTIRGYLKCGIFAAEQFAAESLDLITCFQVIEHVWDPVKIAADAHALLKPGGLFVIVAHDRRAFSARVMGTKSPIFDIEHLQLFDQVNGCGAPSNCRIRINRHQLVAKQISDQLLDQAVSVAQDRKGRS